MCEWLHFAAFNSGRCCFGYILWSWTYLISAVTVVDAMRDYFSFEEFCCIIKSGELANRSGSTISGSLVRVVDADISAVTWEEELLWICVGRKLLLIHVLSIMQLAMIDCTGRWQVVSGGKGGWIFRSGAVISSDSDHNYFTRVGLSRWNLPLFACIYQFDRWYLWFYVDYSCLSVSNAEH